MGKETAESGSVGGKGSRQPTGQTVKVSGSGGLLTHSVGLRRSGRWAWHRLLQIPSTTYRDTPEPQQRYLFHLLR